MPTLDRLLARLEQEKTNFSGGNAAQILRLLAALGRRQFRDPQTLIRFHDALLFLRAYPHNAAVQRQAGRLLDTFVERVQRLRAAGADMEVFDPEQVSGIAGTTMQDTWNYDVIRWLARRFPRNVSIDWTDYDQEGRLAATLPRFIPLLADDADVEADVPFREWLQAASGRRGRLAVAAGAVRATADLRAREDRALQLARPDGEMGNRQPASQPNPKLAASPARRSITKAPLIRRK